MDRRSACFLSSYLAGGEFWVLPDDFMVRLPESKEYIMPDLDVSEDLAYLYYKEKLANSSLMISSMWLKIDSTLNFTGSNAFTMLDSLTLLDYGKDHVQNMFVNNALE